MKFLLILLIGSSASDYATRHPTFGLDLTSRPRPNTSIGWLGIEKRTLGRASYKRPTTTTSGSYEISGWRSVPMVRTQPS